MRIACAIFGHRANGRYMTATYRATDGLNTEHYDITATCSRCNAEFKAGMLHGPLSLELERRRRHERALDSKR